MCRYILNSHRQLLRRRILKIVAVQSELMNIKQIKTLGLSTNVRDLEYIWLTAL